MIEAGSLKIGNLSLFLSNLPHQAAMDLKAEECQGKRERKRGVGPNACGLQEGAEGWGHQGRNSVCPARDGQCVMLRDSSCGVGLSCGLERMEVSMGITEEGEGTS